MKGPCVTVRAPHLDGVTWSMPADAWDRLQARLGEKAHLYHVSPSRASTGRTGASGRTSA